MLYFVCWSFVVSLFKENECIVSVDSSPKKKRITKDSREQKSPAKARLGSTYTKSNSNTKPPAAVESTNSKPSKRIKTSSTGADTMELQENEETKSLLKRRQSERSNEASEVTPETE